MAKKVKTRRRKKKNIKYLRLIIAFGILLGIIIAILNMPIFNISSIEVSGNERVEESNVMDISGLDLGDSFIFFDKENIESNILNLPLVEEVRVRRNFPKRVNIEITERKPASTVQFSNNFILLDRFGYIIDEVDNLMLNLTLLKGIEEDEKISIGNPIFDYVSEEKNSLLKLLFNGENIFKFKSVTLEEDTVELILSNDIIVGFGSYNNAQYKLQVIEQMVRTLEEDSSRQAAMILMEEGPDPILVYE